MKAPAEGFVKTRLSPPLTAAQATSLHCCFVRDTCANVSDVMQNFPVDAFAVYTPAGSEPAIHAIVPSHFGLVLQRGVTFGERLFCAASDLLAMGYDGAVLVDSDSPTVPTSSLELAVSALSAGGDRATIGPCEDGGYYLLGLKFAHERLFEDIAWSSNVVCRQTCDRAQEIALPMTVLPQWYDIDDASSLQELHQEFSAPSEARRGGYPARHSRFNVQDLYARNSALVDAVS